ATDYIRERIPEGSSAVGLATAVQLLLAEEEVTHQHASEITSFREMYDQEWMVKVEHIYREGNQAADYFDSLVHELSLGVHLMSISYSISLYHV
ncbi:hypothetical protein LINPERPRIM_LOCUS38849, partial [Linum perenne]